MKIRDVIHGDIVIDNKLIMQLITTPEFQRLRRIKQLGLSNLVFVSAEHTRYGHSIGVYHVLSKMLENFQTKKIHFYTEDEKLALLVSGLLHDLGHGPLSHASEVFFKYSHEDFTIKIIENKNGEIYKILKKFEKENDMNLISQVISFIKKEHSNKPLNSLISSSLDADRLDYLNRDSYYTGVTYGRVDIDRIIDDMKVYKNKIVFTKKNVHTLEDFILSRYHMFVQVYLNDKSVAYENLISKILNRIDELLKQKFVFSVDVSIYENLKKTKIDIDKYLKIDDFTFITFLISLASESDEELKKWVNVFVRQNSLEEIKEELYKKDKEKIYLKAKGYSKNVYDKDESLYIKEDEKIMKIQSISPIFKLSQDKLEIKVDSTFFEVIR